MKDNQKPLKNMLAMHQKQDLGILSKNTESRLYKHLSKTFDKFDNMLIGL